MSVHRDEKSSYYKQNVSKHTSSVSEGDGNRREGNDHQTGTSGNTSFSNHRHVGSRGQLSNQSLVSAKRTHGHRSASPSQLTDHFPEDPVVARLLRRLVNANLVKNYKLIEYIF